MNSHHDNVVLGHVLRQFLDEAPVGGLLSRDDDIRRQHVERPHVRRQRGWGRVGPQHQHPLDARVDARQVELLQRGQRFLQESVDDMDGSLLEETNHG